MNHHTDTSTMRAATDLNPLEISVDFDFCTDFKDAAGFLELCREVKSAITELTLQNFRSEALELLRVYTLAFERAEEWHPKFILAILDEFPVNRDITFNLLGLSDEIDQAILATKLNTKTRPADKIKDVDLLLLWAIRNNNLSLMEDIVVDACEMINTKFEREQYYMHNLSACFIKTLMHADNTQYLSSARIDEAIAGIVDVGDLEGGLYVDKLARLKMPKTLMKMLEHGRVSKYLHASHQDYDHILACIPDEMTASELNAVQHHLELKGLAETILFDDNIDLDGYIQSMTQSHYKSRQTNDYEKPDLDLSCISYFVGLISEDSFSDPSKKKRIVKLLDAACKAEIDVNKLKITDVWALAERLKVPAFTFKHIACLRGEALEDALGL